MMTCATMNIPWLPGISGLKWNSVATGGTVGAAGCCRKVAAHTLTAVRGSQQPPEASSCSSLPAGNAPPQSICSQLLVR
jgi:hypothetical protein